MVLTGLAVLLGIAVMVAGRIFLGTFLPSILILATISIIAVTLTLRSNQTALRKGVFVCATALVVALAVPASLKIVYPVYHHFLRDGSAQTSSASRSASQGSYSSTNPSAATPGSPSAGAAPYKITIDGQDITVGPANDGGGTVECLNAGNDQTDVRIEAVRDTQDVYVTKTDPPQVLRVSLARSATGDDEYLFDPTQNATAHIAGDAQVSVSGKTYTVTGHISPYLHGFQHVYDGTPVPFEFDATCQ